MRATVAKRLRREAVRRHPEPKGRKKFYRGLKRSYREAKRHD